MMKLLLAGLFPGFLGGFSGPVVGQAAVQRRGAQPAIGGPELFRETTRVSVDSAGAQGNFTSLDPSISADGRYVVFRSLATNLVPLDTNGKTDVFLHDRASGTTTRVSVDSAGEQGNGGSFDASISGDGRFVAFGSVASNLVFLDTNASADAFVHDRLRRITTRVSISSAGEEGNAPSFHPDTSADGRYVTFHSEASNLVILDTNVAYDIFVHDQVTRITTRVSVDSAKGQADSDSLYPSISTDGRYIVFESIAGNLVPRDTNGSSDVFVHDRTNGSTTRVSIDSACTEGNSASFSPSISSDGRYVSFLSYASNLVPGDTNGYGDIFVHDRETGSTTRASISTAGVQANDDSFLASNSSSISYDGRYVVFESLASNLVLSDTNGVYDIFMHDQLQGKTTRISVTSLGAEGNRVSGTPSISSDGRCVAFVSFANNLVLPDSNFTGDIFVR